jgi:hypothetical protein
MAILFLLALWELLLSGASIYFIEMVGLNNITIAIGQSHILNNQSRTIVQAKFNETKFYYLHNTLI